MVDIRSPQAVSAALPSSQPSPTGRGQGEGVPDPALRAALERAVQRARDWLLARQHPEGYWWGELESNVTITAEYLLLTYFMGVADQERWRKIANYIKSKRLPDGTWNKYHTGPSDLDTTVEAYFALKLAGEDPSGEPMRQAREFILGRGGLPNVRVFTKCWLALFGQWDWDGVPMMPPEFIFFPKWLPFNIYEFGSWARATVVAMLVLMTTRPTRPIPDYARLDELYVRPEDRRRYNIYQPTEEPFSWKNLFIAAD
ncbi:MAG: squalene--hopene cyclase, partial [Chloroflexi bacterium]|nr:squalene--hopene cyclase [Chloroflexota bacterium]